MHNYNARRLHYLHYYYYDPILPLLISSIRYIYHYDIVTTVHFVYPQHFPLRCLLRATISYKPMFTDVLRAMLTYNLALYYITTVSCFEFVGRGVLEALVPACHQ